MNKKETDLANLYQTIQGDLVKWGTYVDSTLKDHILKTLFTEIKIPPFFRTKSQRSFLDKALYRGQNYRDPINEIDDKVATRIVLLKSSDILIAGKMIQEFEGWECKVTKDINQLIADKPQIFDYQSMHIVVYPKKESKSFEHEYRYGCEIQIRTLLQHAFAEVSHDSTYKGPYQYDKGIIRHLAKSMALMESTDDYFLDIYRMMADETRKYAALLNGLVPIYQAFVPDFDLSKLNVELSDRLMKLVSIRDVSLNDIQHYVAEHQEQFKRAIKKTNGLLFHQPVIILVGYMLLRHNDTLREYWPLDESLLKDVFLAFNYSYGSY
jgi:putative GTP pyrophosphokinase